jgi:3-oxoacyl-[acyl-carrier protein] reductase
MMMNKTISEDFTNEVSLNRIGNIDEVSATVTFLVSKRANYITGISLPIDGGWIKRI